MIFYIKYKDNEHQVEIDYEFIDAVSSKKWFIRKQNAKHGTKYYAFNPDYVIPTLHRYIIYLKNGNLNKKEVVDHIDGNPLNNKLSNLRICTSKENCRNRIGNKNNKYKGVLCGYSLDGDNVISSIRTPKGKGYGIWEDNPNFKPQENIKKMLYARVAIGFGGYHIKELEINKVN